MKTLNNTTDKVVDALKEEIQKGSKLKIAAASFSIYAYEALKKELEKIDELEFLFTQNVFTKEKAHHESKEFFLFEKNNERKLYGSEFEIKVRNELSQKAIAKECADWIRQKVKFRSNQTGENITPMLSVENKDNSSVLQPFNEFSTSELGVVRGNNLNYFSVQLDSPMSEQYINSFNTLWNDTKNIEDVTAEVLDNITAAYKENAPELIYYIALYNIFREFLSDINQDYIPDERTGFKESKIWNLLYDFQKDAVLGCISKLDKHNGCILADSVGLGKTFSAIGVIKYYESRNKNVLVLCPKRLSDNWNTYKNNYRNNPLAEDRLRYDVLFHTDVDRERGESNGIDLAQLNWGNYDLVVIDESHNFRNGESTTHRRDEGFENRYTKLMNKIIKSGVKTKVLMLSATPVNTGFTDLKNQLMLASEGDSDNLSATLDTKNPVDQIFAQANRAFKDWSSLEPVQRTTQRLLDMLDFDFFELLDSLTIARSRKHIEKYYKKEDIGSFPERRKPLSRRPGITDIKGIDYNVLFGYIDQMNLQIYNPLNKVYPSKIDKYVDPERSNARTWANREIGRNQLMITNLLKRAESSIHSFRITANNIYQYILATLETIEKFKLNPSTTVDELEQLDEGEESLAEGLSVGKKMKIELADMDYLSWEQELREDASVFKNLLNLVDRVTPDKDLKLQSLRQLIREKVEHPINPENRKILIFTAFADTAQYLYDNLREPLLAKAIQSALIAGTNTETTLTTIHRDFNEILTAFSPVSKSYDTLFQGKNKGYIDVIIATDVISEGQNLQDCDYLINYDIHWNPVRIIQRFGRIDRIGSKNKEIQMVNFWPDITLDDYIDLKARVENRMKIASIVAAGDNTLVENDPELLYRKNQLKRLQDEVIDLEDASGGINIMDLGLNEFQLDLKALHQKYGEYEGKPFGVHAVVNADDQHPAGVIFVLKSRNNEVNIDKQNRLHPFYLIYIANDGEIIASHFNPKNILDDFRYLTSGKDAPDEELTAEFNLETHDGRAMGEYSELLNNAISTLIEQKGEKDIDSLFSFGDTSALENDVSGIDDFELIDFLVIR
ncbi:DEAD/DEAH box helicase family protein [Enterococcus faecium]|uniref:helicase-related protein n=1 Tax=Enterococcus faecium TaxID=1352 RepID=UPI0002AF2AFE|nr:helicase-related protein [Enterococcus faecium]ERK34948.1 hypothetical protein I131_13365 [Enterococcus faecium CRL1879]AGE29394.1 DEAD, DEAH box helicase-like protein [Enterococcus faecium ATCC 8459 = NRRL B-2354]EHU5000148.1 DEAD/DEAH box helicase family protein [Enterococcus faecium]EOH66812.1 hypothetical protein UAG_02685 [Enterococcus faecium ATCC 8459 = NRRL B-2354]EOU08031.1 hypothetical protein I581_00013 [Enterococcus faecium ATCC 8459 = NRRL B-2354]